MNKKRIILIIIVVLLLIGFVGYGAFDILKGSEKPQKEVKEKQKVEPREMVNIKDNRCDAGLCMHDFKINRLEDGTFELTSIFENTTETDFEEGCIKVIFTEEVVYYSCYKMVRAGATVTETISMEEDEYSQYKDYKVEVLTGATRERYYDIFEKTLDYDIEEVE